MWCINKNQPTVIILFFCSYLQYQKKSNMRHKKKSKQMLKQNTGIHPYIRVTKHYLLSCYHVTLHLPCLAFGFSVRVCFTRKHRFSTQAHAGYSAKPQDSLGNPVCVCVLWVYLCCYSLQGVCLVLKTLKVNDLDLGNLENHAISNKFSWKPWKRKYILEFIVCINWDLPVTENHANAWFFSKLKISIFIIKNSHRKEKSILD